MGGPLHATGRPNTDFFASYLMQLHTRQAAVDLAEYISDQWSKNHKRSDNDDGNQNKNQRVLNQALALFLGEKAAKHCCYSPFVVQCISALRLVLTAL